MVVQCWEAISCAAGEDREIRRSRGRGPVALQLTADGESVQLVCLQA